MISKKHRFIGRRDPRIVLKHGTSIRSASFKLNYLKSNKHSDYRLAVVVSKKVSKSSPTRNRIRRRIYEQFRLLQDQIPKPLDMVLVVFDSSAATKDIDSIKSEIVQSFAKIKI